MSPANAPARRRADSTRADATVYLLALLLLAAAALIR